MAKVEKVGAISPVSLPYVPPQGLSEYLTPYQGSTVAKSEATSLFRSRPNLPSAYRSAGTIDRLDTLADQFATLTEGRIEREFEAIRDVNRAEGAAIDQVTSRIQEITFWGFLEDMGNMVLAAVSSVFGYSLYTTNAPLAGGLLIAGGILSIGNLAAKHTDAWNWIAETLSMGDQEYEQAIRVYLPAGCAILAGVCGLSGMASAYFFTQLGDGQKILSALQAFSTIATTSSGVGSGIAASRMKWSQSELSILQFKATVHKLALETAMEELKSFSDALAKITQKAGMILKTLTRAIQATQQAV